MLYKNDKPWTPPKELAELEEKTVIFKLSQRYWVTKQYEEKNQRKTVVQAAGNFDLPTTYQYTDTESGEQFVLRYAVSHNSQIIGGQLFHKFKPVAVTFEDGMLRVHPNEFDLLFFLRNHPANRTNRLYENDILKRERDKHGYIFEEKIIAVENKQTLDQEKLELDARSFVLNHNELNDAAAYDLALCYGEAGSLERNTDVGVIRLFLLEKAKENPELFLKYADEATRSLRARVKEAQIRKIITFHPSSGNVMFTKHVTGGNQEKITTIPKGRRNDWIEEFEQWLTADTSGVFERIILFIEQDKEPEFMMEERQEQLNQKLEVEQNVKSRFQKQREVLDTEEEVDLVAIAVAKEDEAVLTAAPELETPEYGKPEYAEDKPKGTKGK